MLEVSINYKIITAGEGKMKASSMCKMYCNLHYTLHFLSARNQFLMNVLYFSSREDPKLSLFLIMKIQIINK